MKLRNFSFVITLLSVLARADDSQFLYKNCADQATGAPLVDCSTLEISGDLNYLRINHYEEIGLKKPNGYRGLVLNSKKIPMAIPDNYQNIDEWAYGDVKYIKSRKKFTTKFYSGTVDSIIVIDTAGMQNGGVDIHSLNDPRAKAMFTFLYSSNLGVVAIGLPQPANSGDVYYCVSDRCLFGK